MLGASLLIHAPPSTALISSLRQSLFDFSVNPSVFLALFSMSLSVIPLSTCSVPLSVCALMSVYLCSLRCSVSRCSLSPVTALFFSTSHSLSYCVSVLHSRTKLCILLFPLLLQAPSLHILLSFFLTAALPLFMHRGCAVELAISLERRRRSQSFGSPYLAVASFNVENLVPSWFVSGKEEKTC